MHFKIALFYLIFFLCTSTIETATPTDNQDLATVTNLILDFCKISNIFYENILGNLCEFAFSEINQNVNEQISMVLLNEKIEEIVFSLGKIEMKVMHLEKQISQLPDLFHITLTERDITNYKSMINRLFMYAKQLAIHPDKYEASRLERAHLFTTIAENSPDALMHKLTMEFTNLSSKSYLRKIIEKIKTFKCFPQSPQQILYSYFAPILLLEQKTFLMINYGFLLLQRLEHKQYEQEIIDATETHEKRIKNLLDSFMEAKKFLPNEVRLCDPKHFEKGITYDEISELMRGYVIKEEDLDPNQKCYGSCSSFSHKKINCISNQCKQQPKCDRISTCESLGNAKVCVLPANSNKRYEYIKVNERTYGNTTNKCALKDYPETTFWMFGTCSSCLCYCSEERNKNSERFLSLKVSKSNVTDNRAVIGVRFVKHNKILHLQVKEAKIGPYGYIDSATIRWVPLDDMKVTSKKVIPHQDYYFVSYQDRSIDLDDVKTSNPNKIVTGVRFKRIGSDLNLEVLFTRYNYTTGKLFQDTSYYEDVLLDQRKEIKFKKPAVPTTCASDNDYNYSKSGSFIKLTHSDLTADAAQSTVPFFDLQSVETDPPSMLQGIGLYHRGNENCGGFLAPKIFTIDKFNKINESRTYIALFKK